MEFKEDIKKGIRLSKSGLHEEALKIMSAWLPYHADDPAFLGVLATAYYRKGDFTNSEYFFSRVLILNPSSELASCARYHSLIHLEREKDAIAEMTFFLTSNYPVLYLEDLKEFLQDNNNPSLQKKAEEILRKWRIEF